MTNRVAYQLLQGMQTGQHTQYNVVEAVEREVIGDEPKSFQFQDLKYISIRSKSANDCKQGVPCSRRALGIAG